MIRFRPPSHVESPWSKGVTAAINDKVAIDRFIQTLSVEPHEIYMFPDGTLWGGWVTLRWETPPSANLQHNSSVLGVNSGVSPTPFGDHYLRDLSPYHYPRWTRVLLHADEIDDYQPNFRYQMSLQVQVGSGSQQFATKTFDVTFKGVAYDPVSGETGRTIQSQRCDGWPLVNPSPATECPDVYFGTYAKSTGNGESSTLDMDDYFDGDGLTYQALVTVTDAATGETQTDYLNDIATDKVTGSFSGDTLSLTQRRFGRSDCHAGCLRHRQ